MLLKLSIIIPCYNIECCLEDMMFSLFINQDPRVEFIIINDGSTDKTEYFINRMLEVYPILNCSVISTANFGLSIARNEGIKLSKGSYIWFLDGDDALIEGAVVHLLEIIKKDKGFDIIAFQGYDFEDRPLKDDRMNYSWNEWLINSYNRDIDDNTEIESLKYLEKEMNKNSFIPSSCFYIQRKRLLIQNNVTFLPNVVFEDVLYTVNLYLSAKSLLILPNRLILHRRRYGSIMKSRFRDHHIFSGFKVASRLNEICRKNKDKINLKKIVDLYFYIALRRCRDNNFDVFKRIIQFPQLFIMNFCKSKIIRIEIYKNIKHSMKLFLGLMNSDSIN